MKLNLKFNQLLLITFVLCSFFAKSEHKLNIIDVIWVTDNWQNYTNKDGTGLYHEMFEAIFQHSPYNIHLKYLPWKRALREIETKKANISGALPNNGKYLFANLPILTQPISILIPKTKSDLTLQQISNLVGVWPEVYTEEIIQPSISPYINGVSAHYREDAVNLLKNKKVDYYIDIRSMLEVQLASLPTIEQQQYQIQNLASLKLFLVFSDDSKGRALKRFYDIRTQTLLDKHILQNIYQKYHVNFSYPE
jgi:hypothetical protein|tara:strand:+ start:308 stop:1060 length:753 start_codon:yes stop_codon:yes gene_type:complete